MTVLLFSGALFTKSYVYSKNDSLINLVTENLEALTNSDIYHIGQGTCGVKFYTVEWIVWCGINKKTATQMAALYQGDSYWCCDSCEQTIYCAGKM